MNKWELTYNQFCQDFLDNNKYKKAYLAKPETWENKKKDLLIQWQNILFNRAEIGSIPEIVIRSYVNIFGEELTRRQFRGTKEKGLADWLITQTKKQLRESVKENYSKLVTN